MSDLVPYFDTLNLRHGESITAFMASGAQAPKFVVILSQRYLYRPPYSHERVAANLARVQLRRHCFSPPRTGTVRPDAKSTRCSIKKLSAGIGPKKSTEYGGKRRKCVFSRHKLDVPHEYSDILRVAVALNQMAPTILSCIADSLNIRSIADIKKLSFSES